MAKEYWYFISGVLLVLLPLALLVAVKKFHWLDVRPDQTIVYATNAAQQFTLHAFPAARQTQAPPRPRMPLTTA